MSFRTVTTFELPESDIHSILLATPGIDVVSSCFVLGENPYLESFETKTSEDKSYMEVYINFHDEHSYNSWHDQWGSVHDNARSMVYNLLRHAGVSINRYWETSDLAASGSKSISEFVSRI